MAIDTSFQHIKETFDARYWDSIDEYEEYYLTRLAETRSDWNYYTDRNGLERTIEPINHFPELKEYEVWIEGYEITGESSTASLLGKVMARNFGQACHIVNCVQLLDAIKVENNPKHTQYCTPGRWDYNPLDLTYWGCRLFWNEKLAKKAFN